jgi:hypothetical protein
VVATVDATDNDAIATYSFATGTQTSADGYFTINNSGDISITATGAAAAVNDYETAPNSGSYDITATDSAGNVTTATITLNEVNVNEAPVAVDNGGNIETVSLTQDNVLDATNVTGFDPYGDPAPIAVQNPFGFGVRGSTSQGASAETAYLNGVGSEKLVVDLEGYVQSVDIAFGWKASHEVVQIVFLKDGVEVHRVLDDTNAPSVGPTQTICRQMDLYSIR